MAKRMPMFSLHSERHKIYLKDGVQNENEGVYNLPEAQNS